MKPNYYRIISECVDTGCRLGVARAFKHTDDPTFQQIEEAVHDAIMLELTDRFHFYTDKEDELNPYEL